MTAPAMPRPRTYFIAPTLTAWRASVAVSWMGRFSMTEGLAILGMVPTFHAGGTAKARRRWKNGLVMRPNILAIAIVTSFLGTDGLAEDLRWTPYKDADFRCVLDYPAVLLSPEAVPPGKPTLFSSRDGDIYFRIQGLE